MATGIHDGYLINKDILGGIGSSVPFQDAAQWQSVSYIDNQPSAIRGQNLWSTSTNFFMPFNNVFSIYFLKFLINMNHNFPNRGN